ncbi:hypothetical protein FOZ62_030741, partial [Perkinsus olseni]
FKSALQEAVAEGAMVVTSAGSEGKDISKNKIYPCAFAEEVDMLCVASVSNDDKLTDITNYAPYVSIGAPGEKVLSTLPTSILSRGYGYGSDAANAAAQVVGAASLLLSLGHTREYVKEYLLDSAHPVFYNDNGELFPSFGRLDAAGALKLSEATVDYCKRLGLGS